MRVSLIIGAAALAISGSAFAQTSTSSNVVIHSAGAGSYPAVVDQSGRLVVGQAPPGQIFHAGLQANTTETPIICNNLVSAKSGNAVDVQQVRITTSVISSNTGEIGVYADKYCHLLVGNAVITSMGSIVISFGPGLISRTDLSISQYGSMVTNIFADGFYLPLAAAPVSPNVETPEGSKQPSLLQHR